MSNAYGISIFSTGSSHAPPLPESIPPELSMRRLDSPGNDSSYYLPSAQESIMSADEASDIDEDEIAGLRSKFNIFEHVAIPQGEIGVTYSVLKLLHDQKAFGNGNALCW